MAYVAPITRSTGDLITAAIWNQEVVDNPIALKAAVDASRALVAYSNTSTLQTSSSTYVDLDATNYSWLITPSTNEITLIWRSKVLANDANARAASYAYQIDSETEVLVMAIESYTSQFQRITGIVTIATTASTQIELSLRFKKDAASNAFAADNGVLILDTGS